MVKNRLWYELEKEEETNTFDEDMALANFDDDVSVEECYDTKTLIDYFIEEGYYSNEYDN